MLSWFSRNNSKPQKTPLSHSDGTEQEHPQSAAPVSTIPEKKPTSQDPTHITSTLAPPAVTGASPAATAPTPEQQQQQPKSTFTAAFNTPHDAVLAELQGHDPPLRADVTPSTSALGMQSIDTLPAAASDAPGSIATSSSPPPEPFYDPFTGVTTGILSPTSPSSGKQSTSTEDLWVHLARIRSLQADVARLHLTMEGIGLAESTVPHLRSTGPRAAVGERLEDDENADGDGGVEAEKRREREFERSERRFDGRKEEIGQIMTKVCRPSLIPFRSPPSFELWCVWVRCERP